MKKEEIRNWKRFITGRLQSYAVEGIDTMKVKVLTSMLEEFFEELETADDEPLYTKKQMKEAIEEAWNLGVSHIGLDIPRSEIDEKYNKLLKKYNLLEEEE